MQATLEAKLERIKHYRTRYELAAVHPDGRRVLIVYSASRSRNSLYSSLAKHAEKVKQLCGSDYVDFAARSKDGARMGEWSIVWTGRTQREAYIEGELPWIGDFE